LFSNATRGMKHPARAGIVYAAVCILLVFLASQPCLAREGEVRGTVRSTDLFNTDLGATVLDARLDTDIEFGHFTLGGAFRAYRLSEKTYNPRAIEVPQPAIKHRYAEVKFENLGSVTSLSARAGHFFATFDRGLTLRSFEDVDLEKDTSLDGIVTEFQLGGLKVSGLSGKAREFINDNAYNEHTASGGRIVFAQSNLVSIAASALARKTERHDKQRALPHDLREFDDTVLGSEAELWLGPVHLAGDYAYRQGDYYPELRQGSIPGHAGYISGTASIAWLTVLGEYKNYRRFADLLSTPPTCMHEHVWTLMNRTTHVVDLSDERGYLAEGTLTAIKDTPIVASVSEARKANGDLAHWEMFGEIDRPITGSVSSTLGGAWAREYAAGGLTEYKTGMAEAEIRPSSGTGFDLGFGLQSVEEHPSEPFRNYLGSATWYPTAAVTVSAVAEGTSQKNLKRDSWIFGEVGARIAEGLDASVGFGTERGGKKCSGGVCYTEPEFTGIRLRLSETF
jgi:hypothetical protein